MSENWLKVLSHERNISSELSTREYKTFLEDMMLR